MLFDGVQLVSISRAVPFGYFLPRGTFFVSGLCSCFFLSKMSIPNPTQSTYTPPPGGPHEHPNIVFTTEDTHPNPCDSPVRSELSGGNPAGDFEDLERPSPTSGGMVGSGATEEKIAPNLCPMTPGSPAYSSIMTWDALGQPVVRPTDPGSTLAPDDRALASPPGYEPAAVDDKPLGEMSW